MAVPLIGCPWRSFAKAYACHTNTVALVRPARANKARDDPLSNAGVALCVRPEISRVHAAIALAVDTQALSARSRGALRTVPIAR